MEALLAAAAAASPLKDPGSYVRPEETPSLLSNARSRLPLSFHSLGERVRSPSSSSSSSVDDGEASHRKLPSGKLQKVCSMDGCTSFSVKRGVCNKHGGADKCASPTCETNAKARGLCFLHNRRGIDYVAPPSQSKSGKTAAAATAGAAARKKVVKRRPRTSSSTSPSPTIDGGAGAAAAEIVAVKGKGKGGKAKITGGKTAGYRALPSGKLQKLCSTEGCTSFSVKRGLCNKHGGPDKCYAPGCSTNAKARGQVFFFFSSSF